ncbi:MAG: TRAP transporter substrate-binding protein DctP [Sphaerochaeta sp.]|nr:TRAP transporter substrate-binding protein DctP [Sphaerochaeta sp.]
MNRTGSKILFGVVILILIGMTTLHAQALPVIRISVENTLAHVQTQAVERFAQRLSQELASHYEIRFYHSASLYKDADVFRALTQGKVEIAFPGTWQFDRYVPEVGLFLLPSLYGRKAETTYALLASDVGKQVTQAIEKAMGVTVFGSFIDLGSTQIFSTKASITAPSDFEGKLIRVAGGMGNSLRVQALGAKPITITWPLLASALQHSQIDGVLTSYETIASARLWERGLSHVYEDDQYFAQYVPIASESFWKRLPPWVQQTIIDAWQIGVGEAREEARAAQEMAKKSVIAYGLKVTEPDEAVIRATRKMLMEQQEAMAMHMGINTELYTHFYNFFALYEESL